MSAPTVVYTVEHATTYRYRRPVSFGEHRMMFRPRDSDDQRLLDWVLAISPEPAELRSVRDASGNVLTSARFDARASELTFRSRLVVSHRRVVPEARHLAPYARSWPFTYDLVDAADLWRLRERLFADPERTVDAWVHGIADRQRGGGTLELLSAVCGEIARGFTYAARHEEGVQEPARTLILRTGTCRDFAVLMMEAVRVLGFASRFVTGYLDPRHGPEHGPGRGSPRGPERADGNRGGGATHAWAEVFLPGLGWTEFDPTNDIVGTRDLIRVGSVGDWKQAVPLSGTWTGFPADALGMVVDVVVSRGRPAAPVAVPDAPNGERAGTGAAGMALLRIGRDANGSG